MKDNSINTRLKFWAKKIKSDVIAVYLAVKHKRTPLYVKIFAAVVVAYALSPIDLIPDFIPILGYLDDIILLPLGLAMAISLIPVDILEECRDEAKNNPPSVKPKIWIGAYLIIITWILVFYGLYRLIK